MLVMDKNGNVSTKEKKFGAFFYSSLESFSDLSAPSQPPEWLNKDLYREGIQFFWDHVLMIFLVLGQSITTGLSVPNLRFVTNFSFFSEVEEFA